MRKVEIKKTRIIFDDIFKMEEAYLRYERFNGEMSEAVRRISLERGDSVSVIIRNLNTDRIILIQQFRYPSYTKGDGWIIEAIAGMVDAGESPEASARREVQEETGLTVSKLELIATFYTTPGGSSERIFLYYSEVSGERAHYSGMGGLLAEGEDIQVMELDLEEAIDMVRSGQIVDAKTIIGIFWLENRKLKGTVQRQEEA